MGEVFFVDLGSRSHMSCCWSPRVVKDFVKVTYWWAPELRHQSIASNSLRFCYTQKKLGTKGFNMYILYVGMCFKLASNLAY